MSDDSNEFERAKYFEEVNRDHALRAHDRNATEQNDYLKAALDTSALAIRSLILVNGAAVISLLAFLGAVEASAGAAEFKSTYLVWPILWFALGVGSGAFTAVLAYLVNLMDHGIASLVTLTWEHPYVVRKEEADRRQKIRNVVHWLAIIMAATSLVSFFGGTISVTCAIMQSGI